MIRNKFLFYFLSFTWGLPLTTIGCIIALALLVTGHKPKKWGYCYYFEIGHDWGGFECGPIFLANNNASEHIKNHELGHGMQNCKFGPLMLFVITIPSAIRYQYRMFKEKIGKPCTTDYDDIWFEGNASYLGTEFMKSYNNTK